MTPAFTPYPGFPEDPARIEEVRQRIAALPPGFSFFDALDEDPEMLAVFKTDQVRGALESNATAPADRRRPEAEVVAYEEWVLRTFVG